MKPTEWKPCEVETLGCAGQGCAEISTEERNYETMCAWFNELCDRTKHVEFDITNTQKAIIKHMLNEDFALAHDKTDRLKDLLSEEAELRRTQVKVAQSLSEFDVVLCDQDEPAEPESCGTHTVGSQRWTCRLPKGHEGWHESNIGALGWTRWLMGSDPADLCGTILGYANGTITTCHLPKGHDGAHHTRAWLAERPQEEHG